MQYSLVIFFGFPSQAVPGIKGLAISHYYLHVSNATIFYWIHDTGQYWTDSMIIFTLFLQPKKGKVTSTFKWKQFDLIDQKLSNWLNGKAFSSDKALFCFRLSYYEFHNTRK